ncbi:6913_t:CDS:10 [Diversispora eburnea]|uniref:cyclin-dependent kinase n=1 Tax=Diversispora eburnea TaxID=1213867 RepID=A0A9N9AKS1_9GLOM|nr:6913_t:CDS:10 [Diversispora eburnea]
MDNPRHYRPSKQNYRDERTYRYERTCRNERTYRNERSEDRSHEDKYLRNRDRDGQNRRPYYDYRDHRDHRNHRDRSHERSQRQDDGRKRFYRDEISPRGGSSYRNESSHRDKRQCSRSRHDDQQIDRRQWSRPPSRQPPPQQPQYPPRQPQRYPPQQSQRSHPPRQPQRSHLPQQSQQPTQPLLQSLKSPKAVDAKLPPTSLPTNPTTVPRASRLTVKPTELYEKLEQIGEGAYGTVFKAKSRENGEIVALKHIRMEMEQGFPITAIREIKILQKLNHEHIVRLKEMMTYKGDVFMIFEYMRCDLTRIIPNPQITYGPQHVKFLMKNLLEGLAHIHEHNILHRDIKPANLLVSNDGELKLCDFGLSRQFAPKRLNEYSNRVVTLCYRSPELCWGATNYGPEIDLWSVGCMMMELTTRKLLFPGWDEISQLEMIFKLMGAPSTSEWPEMVDLPLYATINFPESKSCFREKYSNDLSPGALELVEALLSINPAHRPTAREALNFAYFASEEPEACLPSDIPKIINIITTSVKNKINTKITKITKITFQDDEEIRTKYKKYKIFKRPINSEPEYNSLDKKRSHKVINSDGVNPKAVNNVINSNSRDLQIKLFKTPRCKKICEKQCRDKRGREYDLCYNNSIGRAHKIPHISGLKLKQKN